MSVRDKETVQRSMIKPTISILDSRFQYTASHRTNIAETFERARKAAAQGVSRNSEPRVSGPNRGVEGLRSSEDKSPVAAAPIQIRRKA
jgi:hypothetical protein